MGETQTIGRRERKQCKQKFALLWAKRYQRNENENEQEREREREHERQSERERERKRERHFGWNCHCSSLSSFVVSVSLHVSLTLFASFLLPRLSVYLFLYVLSLFGSFLVLFGLRLSRLPASTPIWVVCVVFYFASSSSFSSASPSSYASFATLGTPPTLQITIRWTPSNKLPTI